MLRFNLFLLSLLLMVGCGSKEKIPGNILPGTKMKQVLEDLMKADLFLSDYVLNKDTSKRKEPESIKLYDTIFALHHIKPDEFYTSLSYYEQHPVLLKPILDSLGLQQQRSKNIKPQIDNLSLPPVKEE